jgi:hypothetical protein
LHYASQITGGEISRISFRKAPVDVKKGLEVSGEFNPFERAFNAQLVSKNPITKGGKGKRLILQYDRIENISV